MTKRSEPRRFDVVLYGASGFVGRQTVAHFVAHAPPGLRWAIAGRDARKLQAVAEGAGMAAPEVLLADAEDAAALARLAASARVMLSSAGPYALYGSGLVAACVEAGTHYVDLTGETPWVRGLIDRHHAQAAASGTRIVPGCGFDSVPSDLCAWLLAEALWQGHGEPAAEVKAAFSLRGGLNGGTFASLLNIAAAGQQAQMAEPFLLNPPGSVPAQKAAHADPLGPHRDADFGGAWLAPFVMGPINTRVVRRSAALAQAAGEPAYALGFRYQEYLRTGRGAAAALLAAGMSVGLNSGPPALKFAPVRRFAAAFAPKPGEGPSEARMDGGGFRCEALGRTASGLEARVKMSYAGDPGNRATTVFVCEAALALLEPGPRGLPGGSRRGGLLTPASALGDALVQRLRARGVEITLS
jgi:short subunit dehydrogenase-like uncharacterized protein